MTAFVEYVNEQQIRIINPDGQRLNLFTMWADDGTEELSFAIERTEPSGLISSGWIFQHTQQTMAELMSAMFHFKDHGSFKAYAKLAIPVSTYKDTSKDSFSWGGRNEDA